MKKIFQYIVSFLTGVLLSQLAWAETLPLSEHEMLGYDLPIGWSYSRSGSAARFEKGSTKLSLTVSMLGSDKFSLADLKAMVDDLKNDYPIESSVNSVRLLKSIEGSYQSFRLQGVPPRLLSIGAAMSKQALISMNVESVGAKSEALHREALSIIDSFQVFRAGLTSLRIPGKDWLVHYLVPPLQEEQSESTADTYRYQGITSDGFVLMIEAIPNVGKGVHQESYEVWMPQIKSHPFIDEDSIVVRRNDKRVKITYNHVLREEFADKMLGEIIAAPLESYRRTNDELDNFLLQPQGMLRYPNLDYFFHYRETNVYFHLAKHPFLAKDDQIFKSFSRSFKYK